MLVTYTHYAAQNMANDVLLRDVASIPSLGTMMPSWRKKPTFGTKNDAYQHDTQDRMEAEKQITTPNKYETQNVADQDGTWDGCTRAQEC